MSIQSEETERNGTKQKKRNRTRGTEVKLKMTNWKLRSQ